MTVQLLTPVDDEAPRDDDLGELLSLVALGDVGAFARVYDLTAGPVFGLIARVTRNTALAEEVTQDVFVQVWQLAGEFRPTRGSARSWIMTIAHRRAVDCVRSTQAATDRDTRIGVRDLDRDFDPVAENIELHVERGHLRLAIARLTPVQREAISLAYFEGLSQPQIAERTATPLGTIKSRMRDGLARLRDELRHHGDTEIAAAS